MPFIATLESITLSIVEGSPQVSAISLILAPGPTVSKFAGTSESMIAPPAIGRRRIRDVIDSERLRRQGGVDFSGKEVRRSTAGWEDIGAACQSDGAIGRFCEKNY